MAKPGKFSQSAPFRNLMAEFVIEVEDPDMPPLLLHTVCDMPVRDNVFDSDVASLIQAAIDHDCD